ncbi:unnamed protein product [Lactuca virosa]|uniref:Clathrin heavy chain n=1 Tax=Lactuca virosa TaxID=75947 RepID=A0AAU9PG70_9ASTR|nr:unnamed protein product [Lactuca virosa]
MQFKDIAVKLYYKAVHFYLQEQPYLINDFLNVLALRVDHTRVVDIMRKTGCLPLVKLYMVAIQSNNVWRRKTMKGWESIDLHDNFDEIGLAQKEQSFRMMSTTRVWSTRRARKANSSKTWKEVCFACVDADEFRLAQICGLHIIVQVDDLEEVSEFYQNGGCFNEPISLMESGLGLERAHMGIFTEMGVLYARYRHEKLLEHIKLFSTRLNIPKLIRAYDEQQHWKELTYLYIQYDEFDNAASTVMNHFPDAWDHMQFKDIAVKVENVELYYKAVHFYLQEHPDLINDVLNVLALRVDHTRVVDIMRKARYLPLVNPYMVAVQSNNVSAVNVALNEIYVEEEDYDRLREFIDLHAMETAAVRRP